MMNERRDEDVLSCQQAADALNLKVRTVYAYSRLGMLRPICEKGKHPHFTPDYIEMIKANGYEPIDIHYKEKLNG